MTSLRRPDETLTASRRALEKIIYDFSSDISDSHVHQPTYHLRQDKYIAPSVLPLKFDTPSHESSMKNCTAPGPNRARPEHLKSLPAVVVRTLARLFTRYLNECKVPASWKTGKTVVLNKRGDPDYIGNYHPICMLSVVYGLFTPVYLNSIGRLLEGQFIDLKDSHASKQGF